MPGVAPLIAPGDERRCFDVISEIAQALEGLVIRGEVDGASLSGACGLALFFEYLSRSGLLPQYDGAASRCLELALDSLEGPGRRHPGLYDGVAGIIWTLWHLKRIGAPYALAVEEEGTSEALISFLEDSSPLPVSAQLQDADLLYGVIGFSVAGMEDMTREQTPTLLGLAAERLLSTSASSAEGLYWVTHPTDLDRTVFPDAYVNLGVAHGMPAALVALAAAHRFGHKTAGIAASSAVRWLQARDHNASDSHFSSAYTFKPHQFGAQSAWCYGDPGVSCALYVAGTYLASNELLTYSQQVASTAARRRPEAVLLDDAGLCHGTAGLAHMFRRWFEWSQDEQFAEIAGMWYRETLNLRKADQGVAGFKPRREPPSRNDGETAILSGVTGIGLALLTALTGLEPAWDRVLLMSPESEQSVVPPNWSRPRS